MDNARAQFGVPRNIAYFNTAYFAPRLEAVQAAGHWAVDRCRAPWQRQAAHLYDETDRLRERFAAVIGADGDGVALVPAVSYGMAVAARNVPLRRGSRVLVLEAEHASNYYAWRDSAAAAGAELVTVPRPADFDWTRAVLAALDESTAVVAVPPCHWTDGSRVDLVAVGARARAVGAVFVVDATQALGASPLDVREIQADFLVSVGYKWLFGPYGLAYLWAAPRFRDGRPLELNWIQRQIGTDLGSTAYPEEYLPGARRYDMGERSQFTLAPMAIAALEQVAAWGPAAVAGALQPLTDRMEARARELGLRPVPRERRVAHILGLRGARPFPSDLIARLAAAGVYASLRGGALRLAPHLHVDDADVDRLFTALGRELSS